VKTSARPKSISNGGFDRKQLWLADRKLPEAMKRKNFVQWDCLAAGALQQKHIPVAQAAN
jgi:hypothetical protein